MKKILFTFLCAIGSLSLLAQMPKATIPFELFGEHIFIKLSVNGSEPLDFIFDTGDGLTVLNIETAREMDMVSDGKVKKTSAGGSVTGALLKHQKVELGGQPVNDIEIYETSLNHLEISIGRSIDGIIGYDVLDKYAVKIDYTQNEFILYDENAFLYNGDGKSFDLKLNSYIPYIPATVTLSNGKKLKGDFFVDTGARTSVDFNTPFVNKNNIVSQIGDNYSYSVAGLSSTETKHYKGRASNFSFGGFSFDGLPIGLSQAEHGIQNNSKVAGILGNELLKHFNITYDYAHKKIYFEQNNVFDNKFMVDAAGIDFQYDKDMKNILIHQVHENSPAAEKGIKVDAQLLEVNGKSATDYTLPELRDIFSSNGDNATVKILQDGEEIALDFALKNLI